MYAILASAFAAAFNWLIRGVVVKFLVFTALAYIIGYIIEFMLTKVDLASIGGIGSLVSALPTGLLYYVGVFKLDVGIPMIIAAYFIRFGIRRLPIIG